MNSESMTMLTWALEHPYLYTLIKLKHAIIAVSVASIIKSLLKIMKSRCI